MLNMRSKETLLLVIAGIIIVGIVCSTIFMRSSREEEESIVFCHQVRTFDKRLRGLNVIPMGCYQGDGKCLIY